MKGLFNKIFIAVVAALAMVSCVQSDEMLLEDVLGDWYYESAEADMPLQIYVSFAKDRSFQLFQKDGEGAFRRYVGTYTYDGTVLDGVYSDKVQWKEAKMVSREGDILVLKGPILRSFSWDYGTYFPKQSLLKYPFRGCLHPKRRLSTYESRLTRFRQARGVRA